MRGRTQAGTGVRRELDLPKVRDAMKDARAWCSYGIVATVGDDGTINDTDQHAVLIAPGGVAVDVVLAPSEEPVTCRYAGIAGGPDVTIYAPIHAGDEVLVVIPDGQLGLPPVIVAIMTSRAAPLPIENDGKPVFRNDRLSIFSRTVPIEIRTPGGSVRVEPDGKVNLGAPDAGEQLVLGTSYRSAEHEMNAGLLGLSAAFNLLQTAAVGPLAPLKPGFIQAKAAIDAFEAQASAYLSDQVRTK